MTLPSEAGWSPHDRAEDFISPRIGTVVSYTGESLFDRGDWVFVGWRRNTAGRSLLLVKVPDEDWVDRLQTPPKSKWITHMNILFRDFRVLTEHRL